MNINLSHFFCIFSIAAVAVASGAHIYIYKNLRPYFKVGQLLIVVLLSLEQSVV